MAFTEDAYLAKLSTLNESQDSIVSVANWIMFHRRHTASIANIWLQRVKESNAPKRLILLYLANEIVQQSKQRKKEEWQLAFAQVIVEGVVTTIKVSPHDIAEKIRRLVEVWRQRAVFGNEILQKIEEDIGKVDTTKKRGLGGGLFSGGGPSMPAELTKLGQAHAELSKSSLGRSAVESTVQDARRLIDKSVPKPPAPKYSAQLAPLLKNLQSAEGAVQAGLTARKSIIEELQQLLSSQQAKAQEEEKQLETLREQRTEAEQIRKDVEDRIMRGLEEQEGGIELERPEMEPLTPPLKATDTDALQSTTPPGEPPNLDASLSILEAAALPAASLPTDIVAGIPADPRLAKRTLDGMNGGDVKRQKTQEEMTTTNGDALEGIDPEVQAMLE